MVSVGYLGNIIVLIRWDADHYLLDRETELEILMRVQNMILELQRQEKGASKRNNFIEKRETAEKTKNENENIRGG